MRGLDETSDHTGMTFALAVNYGSRSEIVRAARMLAANAAMGNVSPDEIDEELFSANLYTAGLPDPDLLIRTSGEMRLSNYLLWQLAYTEFYVTDLYWPDFSRWEFLRAIRSFQSRDRRFGGVEAK
jgi:undecaprenyl diphosphate synthase